MIDQPVFYPKARIKANQAAKNATLAKLLGLMAWGSLGLGILLGGVTLVFVVTGACTPAWIAGILAGLMLLQFPLLALLATGAESHAFKQSLAERELMNTACLHGEVPWGTHSLGYRF